MSHGSTERCEPNMTPLLDLVLQLVMFFMLAANFVMDQSNKDIKLPEAIAAKALDKNQDAVFFLNVNKQGYVLLTPSQQEDEETKTLENAIQVQSYMQRRAKVEYRKQTGKSEDPPPGWTSETVLIMRIDKETPFEKTYPIMSACRKAHYKHVQLRAIRSNEG
jgi:biopolymer transport protein ExbD